MVYKFALKKTNYKVDAGEYGIFTVREFGSNEELELKRLTRESSEIFEKLDSLSKQAEGASEKKSDKLLKEVEKLAADIDAKREPITTLWQSVITAESDEQLERLFREVPLIEIQRMVRETIANAKN